MSNWEGGQVPAEDTNAGLGTYGEYCRNPVDRVNVAEVSDDERFAHTSRRRKSEGAAVLAHTRRAAITTVQNMRKHHTV